ncbi:MAG: hypothetical protein M1379_05610 [Firmicutes bacterium]|nr:hypothetical protein [Bacillota bacterium]
MSFSGVRKTDSVHPAGSIPEDRWPWNRPQGTGSLGSAAGNWRQGTGGRELAAGNWQQGTSDLRGMLPGEGNLPARFLL